MTTPVYSFFKYFPVSEQMRSWGFCVISVGHSCIPPHTPYPPVKHPEDHNFTWQKGRALESYTLVYIPNGRGRFESRESGPVAIHQDNLFIVYPHVWHRYRPDPETGWEEYWIEFEGECADRFMARPLCDPAHPVFDPGPNDPLMELFRQMVESGRQESHGFQYLLAGGAVNALTMILAQSGTARYDSEKIETINQAKKILTERMAENLDLKQLAAQLCVSYSWFRKHFKEITGLSPRQYQLEFRLRRARELLINTDLSVNQIATRLGFSSVYYFSQQFKLKTGLSPLPWRRQRIQSNPPARWRETPAYPEA